MSRFFVDENQIQDGVITIIGQDAFHIARSLRMAVGDEVCVCDKNGNEYTTELTKIRDDECACKIISERAGTAEPPCHITLYMAYPKGDKLETVVQKSVELGASRIIPFESSRCIKRPPEEKMAKITARLSKIAEEAAKQCHRSKLPKVLPMVRFKNVTEQVPEYDLCLFCYEGDGAESLKSVLEKHGENCKTVAVIIGSEGGFSPEEADQIIAAGAKCVNLGPRILRCETAPDYCLSALSYYFEL